MIRLRNATLGTLPLLLLACGGEGGDNTALAPTVRDSAGVRIVEHPAAVFEQDTVALGNPIMVIGAAEGDGADVFGAISGVARLSDGAVAVLDRQAAEVRVFRPDGSLRTRFGRNGGGPGEFEYANILLALAGDTIAVVDQGGSRVHRFAAEGRIVSAERLDTSADVSWIVTGVFRDGAWLTQSRTRVDGPPPDGVREDWTLAGVRLRGMNNADSLTRMRTGMSFIRNFDQGFGFTAVPFAPRGAVDVVGEAIVAHDGKHYELRVVGRDASTRMLVRVVAEPPAITDADFAADLDRRFGSLESDRRASAEREIASIPRQTRHAGFGAMRTDGLGRIWTSVTVPPASSPDSAYTPYLVLDADGTILGRILLQPRERIGYVDAAHLVTIGRDELDVEQVWVYELPDPLRNLPGR